MATSVFLPLGLTDFWIVQRKLKKKSRRQAKLLSKVAKNIALGCFFFTN